jgi:hypothetical protein
VHVQSRRNCISQGFGDKISTYVNSINNNSDVITELNSAAGFGGSPIHADQETIGDQKKHL